MRATPILYAIASLCLAGCATTQSSTDLLPMRLIGPEESWAGEVTSQGVSVTGPHGRFSSRPMDIVHFSVSPSMIMMNAEWGQGDYVSVLLNREACTVNGRDYGYSAYFGARRVEEGDYVLRGCAEPSPQTPRR